MKTMKHPEPEFTYTPVAFGYSIRARFYGRYIHLMTVLSERLAIETVQLYESGVLEWTP